METPTINVNIAVCHCGPDPHCTHHNKPLHLPCPIPRSVTFVVLGKCACATTPGPMLLPRTVGLVEEAHGRDCPARPVKVSCSISGATWEESHISAWETEDGIGLNTTEEARAADERWALVKALVLEQDEEWRKDPRSEGWNLQPQRDAVYAALADMARAEEAALKAQKMADDAFSSARYAKVGDSDHRAAPPSVNRLRRYVEHLIEQVGVLL